MKLTLSFSIMQHQYRNSLSLHLNVQSIVYVFNFITVYTNVYMTSYIYFITTYSSDPSPKITNIWLWNFSFNGVISLEYLNLVEWRFIDDSVAGSGWGFRLWQPPDIISLLQAFLGCIFCWICALWWSCQLPPILPWKTEYCRDS
jgi:hypothetical protein